MIYLTEEQYKKVIEADNNPINDDYIQQFLSEVRVLYPEVTVYELS